MAAASPTSTDWSTAFRGYTDIKRIVDGKHKLRNWPLSTDENITLLLNRISTPFYIRDTAKVNTDYYDKFFVHLARQTSKTHRDSPDLMRTPDVLDKFLAAAQVAPFGRGNETVVDTTVRHALQIPAKDLDVSDLPSSIYFKINEELCPPGPGSVNAKLYKMHIYGPGGHFESHVDTAHSDNHMATLVVVLPINHTGGALQVSHHGVVETFEVVPRPNCIEWCAFYTDCEHKVLPVTSGHRVVLQYDLFYDMNTPVEDIDKQDGEVAIIDSGSEEEEEEEEQEEDDNGSEKDQPTAIDSGRMKEEKEDEDQPKAKKARVQTFDQAFKDKLESAVQKVLDAGKSLGIVLRHKYVQVGMNLHYLRGTDATLGQLLSKYWLEMVPVLVQNQGDYQDEEYTLTVYSLDQRVRDNLLVVPSSRYMSMQLLEKHDYIEHTGNEAASADYVYASAMLVIRPQR